MAPSSYADTEKDMDSFISTWKDIAVNDDLYYYIANTDDYKSLLSYYGQPSKQNQKPTLNAMRDVEQSSTLYLYEGGQI